MFRKILISNRGEIAVRVMRACREMGIATVAVYSDADERAVHVQFADEAVCIGPAQTTESYLNITNILDAARNTRAEAIHPGYGFLAENAEFARATTASGFTFIGPPAEAIEIMGSKTSARLAATQSGVPVVPGTVESVDNYETACSLAADLGYPVMLKAAAGGGGKGMRLVTSEADLQSALINAQSEAAAAFGDSTVYLEKLIERPRHIEIQIFADQHGNVVHLGERECSIQRRHQKVIEECPSPMGDESLRQVMGEAAVNIARLVNYVGAGTVEFLVPDGTKEFYFLEVNTRLQVEHPVTELVTGYDLVREQIAVAAGNPLSFKQADVRWTGHAIECRVYAEDPENDFFPSPGTITHIRPPAGPGIRDDSGVRVGSEVTIHYDSLISKLIAWGRNRSEAIDRLRRALDEYEIAGIKTTLPFFREIVRSQEFIAGQLDTGFISRFNQYREAARRFAPAETEEETSLRDIASIAASFHYVNLQRSSSPASNSNKDIENRWKLSGRASAGNMLKQRWGRQSSKP